MAERGEKGKRGKEGSCRERGEGEGGKESRRGGPRRLRSMHTMGVCVYFPARVPQVRGDAAFRSLLLASSSTH